MESYKLDIVSKTLVITEGFDKKIKKAEGTEYQLYLRLMTEIPGLTVVRRTHKSPSKCTSKSTNEVFKCNQFKNLSYKNMKTFMSALPNNKEYIEEYEFIRDYAGRIQTNAYALTRRWFVAQFPLFRKNPLFYVYNTPALVPASQIIQKAEQEASEVKKTA